MIWFLILWPVWADPSTNGLPNEECIEEAPSMDSAEQTGQQLYQTNCQSCHQADGLGKAKIYPPLTNSEWVQTDPKVLANVLLRGLSGEIYVGGERYASYMSAYGKDLSDKELQTLIHYVQTEFGYPTEKENVSLLDEDDIAKIRAAQQKRVKGMNGLKAISEE
jgi:mono/diheme cytochrome c family protein